MPQGTKVATCCYCGTRAALVLRGKDRHELTCSACGAPLHDLKMMPMQGGKPRRNTSRLAPPVPHDVVKPIRHEAAKPDKRKRKYKKKSKMRYFIGEAFDLIEDIFD